MRSTTSRFTTIAAIALGLGACGTHAAGTAASEKVVTPQSPCLTNVIAVDTENATHRTTVEGAKQAMVQLGWAEPTATIVQANDRAELRNRTEAVHALAQLYPKKVRDKGIGGEVTFAVLIDATGKIVKKQRVKSSGNADLDLAGETALNRMKFHPAQYEGCRVASWTVLPLTFSVHP